MSLSELARTLLIKKQAQFEEFLRIQDEKKRSSVEQDIVRSEADKVRLQKFNKLERLMQAEDSPRLKAYQRKDSVNSIGGSINLTTSESDFEDEPIH
jgi:hypothetical protein